MMKMNRIKYIIFVLCLPLLSSGQNSNSDFLFGEWILYNSRGITCFDCPKLLFAKEGKGNIVYPKGDNYEFNWLINKSVIVFSFNDNKWENWFFSKEDSFFYSFEKNDCELKLKIIKEKKTKKVKNNNNKVKTVLINYLDNQYYLRKVGCVGNVTN